MRRREVARPRAAAAGRGRWLALLGLALLGLAGGAGGFRFGLGADPSKRERRERGRRLVPAEVGLPGGGRLGLQYRAGAAPGARELQAGAAAFEVFPPDAAAALVEALERWAAAAESGSGPPFWSLAAAAGDGEPELAAPVWPPRGAASGAGAPGWDRPLEELVAAAEAGAGEAGGGGAAFLLPLLKRVWADALQPHLAEVHGVPVDPATGALATPVVGVFVRKYGADLARRRLPAHQDGAVFAFDVALSDPAAVGGGELFVCKQVPFTYAKLLTDFAGDLKAEAVRRVGGASWFDLHHSAARVRRNLDGAGDLCRVAQPEAGEAVLHPGRRVHGVLPVAKGVRYSLVFLAGPCADYERCGLSLRGPAEHLEPSAAPQVMRDLPRAEALSWLAGYGHLLQACKQTEAVAQRVFANADVAEFVAALDRWMDDPEVGALALHAAYSHVAKGGPFDRLLLARGDDAAAGRGGRAQVHALERAAARLRALPEAPEVLARAVRRWGTSREKLGEVCSLAASLPGRVRGCERVKQVKKWTGAGRLQASEAGKLHARCAGAAGAGAEAGAPIQPDCFKLLQTVAFKAEL